MEWHLKLLTRMSIGTKLASQTVEFYLSELQKNNNSNNSNNSNNNAYKALLCSCINYIITKGLGHCSTKSPLFDTSNNTITNDNTNSNNNNSIEIAMCAVAKCLDGDNKDDTNIDNKFGELLLYIASKVINIILLYIYIYAYCTFKL